MFPCHSALGLRVDTPVQYLRFNSLLLDHPDRRKVDYVINGFSCGFDIGVEGKLGPGSSVNNRSALRNKSLVDDALADEISQLHLWSL